MNKKANDQLKKIDQLDQQLDNTINKIGVTKIKPIKISKKKLALFILIPFSIACVISAVTSFLLIDPFHWYTKPRSQLELQQEKEIKQINQQFENLNLASSLDNSNTIADLLFEINNNSNINDIVKKINEFNEIKDITSKKPDNSKLSSDGENVNIKIIVRTGSLEKEIDVSLVVIVGNYKVKRIGRLLNYANFLNSVTEKIETNGENRVSNLVNIIERIISENDEYKAVFNDINFDITNDKNDDEIIASGIKTLNVDFSFTENDRLISSSVKLNLILKGKSRKEINQFLADDLSKGNLSFGGNIYGNDCFFAQTVFADNSTYKDLIDELISFAPENKFYLRADIFERLDNTDSKVSIEFTIDGKTDEELNEQIIISNGKLWKEVELKLQFFVGNGEDKCKESKLNFFTTKVMKENYVHKDLLLRINNLRKVVSQDFLNFKVKTKIGEKYINLKEELDIELKKIMKSENIFGVKVTSSSYLSSQSFGKVISKENLINKWYYIFWIQFTVNETIITNPSVSSLLWLPVRIEK